MPGSATIGSNLVDSLLGVVDELRGSLNPDMGVRQWRVYRVVKTWTGGRRGVGTSTSVEVEITPQPRVIDPALRRDLIAAGIDEAGRLLLSEISLTYTEAELIPTLTSAQSLFYVLRDAHGQAMDDRYFTVGAPPMPDRIKEIGWTLDLRRASSEDAC